MKKKRIIKGINLTLISSMILSNIVPALAKTSVASVDETIEINSAGTSETSVYAELGSEFVVTVPKSLTLSGVEKKGTYTVSVEGDIAGYEKVNVIPDESFNLESTGLNDVTASIAQDKTSWLYSEFETAGNGTIDASGITAGIWNGTFNFNINLETNKKGSSIEVTAKNENGEDLNASAYEISGTKKDTLLSSLEESQLIDSADEVDALIEVESDQFEGMADTTFNVSSIAGEGDKVAILHFNEEKQEWEYIGTETVDAEGNINADFSSYSPVAFVKITDKGDFENIEIAGLYDTEGKLLCTWEESKIPNDCRGTYNIIKNTYPKTTKIVISENVTDIGYQAFYQCTGLTSIKIPEGITNIGQVAFSNCTSLTNVTIPNSVTSIGDYAFYKCTSLTNIEIPQNVTYIGEYAFKDCKNLATINYAGTEEQWNAILKGYDWKGMCPSDMQIIYNYTK